MGHADTASSIFSVGSCCVLVFCFFSGFPYPETSCGVRGNVRWRRVEPCESGRRVVACLEPGPRAGRDTHLTSQLLRVAHVSHSHTTHACTPPRRILYGPCLFYLAYFPFLRARPHIPLPVLFFSDDGQRQGHTCGERERDGDTYIVNRVESSRACTCDMQDHVPLHQDASCAPVTLSGPSAS